MFERKKMPGILAAFFLAISVPAAAKIRVVATIPELGDLVRKIAGDQASVDVLARGSEDIHQITMKPSFVSKLWANRSNSWIAHAGFDCLSEKFGKWTLKYGR